MIPGAATLATAAAAIALALASGLSAGWKLRDWKAGAEDAERLRAENRTALLRAERIDAAAARLEQRKEQIRVETRTLVQEVERLVERPVYRDGGVCLDDDGLRLVTAAAAGAASATAGESEAALPAAAGAE